MERSRFNDTARALEDNYVSNSTLVPSDWRANNHRVLSTAQSSSDRSAVNRRITEEEDKKQRELLAREQAKSKQELADRVRTINCYMRQLEIELGLAKVELTAQVKNRERILKAIQSMEIPIRIVTENLAARNKRLSTDQVNDNAEIAMVEEKGIYGQQVDMLHCLKEKAEYHETELKACINALRADLADKKIANAADSHAVNLNNRSCMIDGSDDTSFLDLNKTVSFWRARAESNMSQSSETRARSAAHRDLTNNKICAHVKRCKHTNEEVNRAVKHRIFETSNQRQALCIKLGNVTTEFRGQEMNKAKIETALRDQIPHFQVNSTRRLHRNTKRPDQNENIHDQPEVQLMIERSKLDSSKQMMLRRLEESERMLCELHATMEELKREIEIKKTTLEIDQKKIVPMRSKFPNDTVLGGL